MKREALRNNSIIAKTSALIAVVLLAGCSTISEDEFLCPDPESGVCVDSKTAYEAAERGIKNAEEFNEHRASQGKGEYLEQLNNVAPVVGTMSEPIRQPKPILMPAKVLRVWINAYEDEAGALHMPQLSFVEVTPRKWSLENVNAEQFNVISPFKVVKRNNAGSNSGNNQ